MKKFRVALSIVFLSGFFTVSLKAQDGSDYKSGIGLRAGGGYYDIVSASYKTFITAPGALELNLGLRPYTGWFHLSFSGAYQHHFPIGSIEGFKWFVGGGLIGVNTFSKYDYDDGFRLGIFPTGGVDYKFANIPLNVSADIRPTYMIVRPDIDKNTYPYYVSPYSRFYAGNVGASVRYTF